MCLSQLRGSCGNAFLSYISSNVTSLSKVENAFPLDGSQAESGRDIGAVEVQIFCELEQCFLSRLFSSIASAGAKCAVSPSQIGSLRCQSGIFRHLVLMNRSIFPKMVYCPECEIPFLRVIVLIVL